MDGDPAVEEGGSTDRHGRTPAGPSTPDGVAGTLRLAYREHRPYLAASAGLFALAVVGGVALQVGGVDLFAALGLGSLGELFPDRITAVTILVNNTRAFALFVAGALTGGLLTLFGLGFNGLVVGFVVADVVAQRGVAFVFVGLAPHGVLELPALFAAAAVSFRVVVRLGGRVFGDRDRVMSRAEWRRTGGFVLAAWVALAVAAFVEFYVTAALLDALFG